VGPVTDSHIELWGDQVTTPDEQHVATLPKELHSTATTSPKDTLRPDVEGLRVDDIIVSVSNRKEASESALGSVIVLSGKTLRQRGYTDLSQVLDDLPGMDVIRPFGDTYVRSYWRGNRTVGSDPYLLLLDGVAMNQLFTNNAQMLATLPISAIDHIEVVFSPVSAVYGPLGSMGVIHIITNTGAERQANQGYGPMATGWVTFGGPQNNFNHFGDTTKLVDGTVAYTAKDYRVRLSTRLESSVADTSMGSGFVFTGPDAYTSPTAWGTGTLSTYPSSAGAFRSPDNKAALDGRLYLGKGTELAGQYFNLSTGFGTVYPGDRQQTMGESTGRELSFYARHLAEITSGFTSTSLIRYRESTLHTSSLTSDTAAVTLTNADAPASAIEVHQDFDITSRHGLAKLRDQVGVSFGLRYQHTNLPGGATGYNVTSSSTWAPNANPIAAGKVAPDQFADAPIASASADEFGGYLYAKYAFNPNHAVSLAFRGDKEQARDDVGFDFRGGYAGTFIDVLTLKVWYGYTTSEPSWQQQLAATVAPNTSPTLPASGMHTVEGDLDLRFTPFALHGDVYYSYMGNPVVAAQPAGGVGSITTLDHRELLGAEAQARLLIKPFSAFIYYTHTFMNDDAAANGNVPRTYAADGDIASDKLWAGVTLDIPHLAATLLTRWIADRPTVFTNPTGTVNWYALLDANIIVSDVFDGGGPWFGLRATNIIGTTYQQPGIQTADSGNATAASAGPYNSLLGQPGRAFYVTAGFTFDPDTEKRAGK
jgi:iron complex outermembrane receptor protein